MPDNETTVWLVTADDRLCEAVRQQQPPGVHLHCAAPPELPLGQMAVATEVWIDLDVSDGLPELPIARRAYFHSPQHSVPAHLPTGLFIRKPCPDTVVQILWARLERPTGQRATLRESGTGVWLPGWIMEFHELGLRELCRRSVQRLGPRLGYADVSMYLNDPDDQVLTLAETTHKRSVDLAVSLHRDETHLMVAVARSGKVLVSNDAVGQWKQRGLRRPTGPQRYADGRTPATEVGVPLEALFRLIGRSLRFARAYDRARTQARIDPLTGLYNNRWMTETLTREIRRSQRSGSPLSAIVIDLDGLKGINDREGHRAGDCLLRHVAGQITAALRQADSAARVGGDEFVLLLPATDREGARSVARRALESIRTNAALFRDTPLPISASVGVAEWQPPWDVEQFIEAADRAMYQAKKQGRDQLVCLPAEATAVQRLPGKSQRRVWPAPEIPAAPSEAEPGARILAPVTESADQHA
jgi:diguanylate cyclase (GGDEF)-like protein